MAGLRFFLRPHLTGITTCCNLTICPQQGVVRNAPSRQCNCGSTPRCYNQRMELPIRSGFVGRPPATLEKLFRSLSDSGRRLQCSSGVPAYGRRVHDVRHVTASRISMKTQRKIFIMSDDTYVSADFVDRKGTVAPKGTNANAIAAVHTADRIVAAGSRIV